MLVHLLMRIMLQRIYLNKTQFLKWKNPLKELML